MIFGLIRRWRYSLLFSTVVAVVGAVYLVGFLFMAATWWFTQDLATRQATERLGELIDTVESTGSVVRVGMLPATAARPSCSFSRVIVNLISVS